MPAKAKSESSSPSFIETQVTRIEELIKQNEKLDQFLSQMEDKIKLKKPYIVIVTSVVLILWLASGHAGQLVCNAIGFVYPAYASIKAIESANKSDDTKWLIYWVVFATFSILESFSDLIIGWLPFYWLGKCAFLIWCMSPLNGSVIVYKSIILPIFRENEATIDQVVSQGKEKLSELTEKTTAAILDTKKST